MEYIHTKPGEIDWGIYEKYIQSIRQKLPEHIYAFAVNPNNYNFGSHSSLHDSWLESLVVKETAAGNRNEIRKLEVEITLFGPFHDRRIHLRYTGVTQYSFVAPPRHDDPRYQHTAHGDLFTHEIRLGHGGLFVHELLFERDAVLFIECSDIKHWEVLIEKSDLSSTELTKHRL
ncbi:MAG TPA: hypothetical protein VK815_04445 [Candidatus Acidoferrales bacterium]|jgi:hypothetical protein|nr:hypothetical protein [Candidatus Acidoferrales bacterium]